MVHCHPSETYINACYITWYGWIDLHDPQHRIASSWLAHPTIQKSALTRSNLGVWYHCHVPSPLYWLNIINLRLIQSIFHHWIVIVCPVWASTLDITIVTTVSYHAKIGSIIGGFGCIVPLTWYKPTVMVYYHLYGTYTKHIAPLDSNSLHCVTLNTRYPHHD